MVLLTWISEIFLYLQKMSFENEVTELKSQTASYREQVCALQSQVTSLSNQNTVMSQHNAKLQGENARLQVENTTLQSQSASLIAQNSALQSTATQMDAEKDKVCVQEEWLSSFNLLLYLWDRILNADLFLSGKEICRVSVYIISDHTKLSGLNE